MSTKCANGIRYDCPHIHGCESDSGVLSSTNPNSPHLIYVRSKEWSSTTRTWTDEDALYACQPKNKTRIRNIALIQGETFYEQDVKRDKGHLLKETLEEIGKLMVSKGLITSGR